MMRHALLSQMMVIASQEGSPFFEDNFNALDLDGVTSAPNKWTQKFLAWNVRYLSGNSDDGWKTYDERVEPGRTRTAKQVIEQDGRWATKTRYLHDVSGGTIKLRGYPVAVGDQVDTASFPYICGMISNEADTGADYIYGYIEVRVKINSITKGQHLALWLIANDGTWPPEIDILEVVNSTDTWNCNTHGEDPPQDMTSYKPKSPAGWHTLGFNWDSSLMSWYFDGVLVRQHANSITTKAMNFLATYEIASTWPGDPDGTTVWPCETEIDYVRAYAEKPAESWSGWRYCGETRPSSLVGSGSVVFTEPLGSKEGDLQVVQLSYRGDVPFATPSGWSLAVQDSTGNRSFNGTGTQRASVAVFYRVRGSTAGTLTFSRGAGTVDEGLDCVQGAMSLYQTPGTASLVSAAFGADTGYAGATVSVASQSTQAGDLVVGVLAASDNVAASSSGLSSANITASSAIRNAIGQVAEGWQVSTDAQTSLGSDGGLAVGHAIASGSSTGTTTATFSGGSGHSAAVAVFRTA